MTDDQPASAAPVEVEEWRVTGQPQPLANGTTFPFYVHVWRSDQTYDERSRMEGDRVHSAEQAARRFVAVMRGWGDGPHLHHRTVTYSPWEEA